MPTAPTPMSSTAFSQTPRRMRITWSASRGSGSPCASSALPFDSAEASDLLPLGRYARQYLLLDRAPPPIRGPPPRGVASSARHPRQHPPALGTVGSWACDRGLLDRARLARALGRAGDHDR